MTPAAATTWLQTENLPQNAQKAILNPPRDERGRRVLALLLGMAMVCNMFVAATAGTLVPLGLKWMKVDPALGSSVFITTFTDVVGFASFLGLATIFLRYLVQ